MPIEAAHTKFHNLQAEANSLVQAWTITLNSQTGNSTVSPLHSEWITETAFTKLFIAFEDFMESAFCHYLLGSHGLNLASPIRRAMPTDFQHASKMVKGKNPFTEWGNAEQIEMFASLYFVQGHPFSPALKGSSTALNNAKVLRNAMVHRDGTTQVKLEGLAQRLLTVPKPGITPAGLLTSYIPRSMPRQSVYAYFEEVLSLTVDAISNC